MCFLFACQLVRNDSDLPIIITSVPGFGKGTLAIKIARKVIFYIRNYFHIDIPKFQLASNIIYTASKKDFNDLLSLSEYNIKIIDEGYLAGLNLESSTEQAIFTGKVVNIGRSHHNLLIFCYQNPTRATKFLMEAFYVWIHKYTRGTDEKIVDGKTVKEKPGRAAVLARTKLFTTKDPWGLDRLLKAVTEQQIVARMRNNKNLAFFLKTKSLPQKYFEKYEAIKHREQNRYRMLNETKSIMREAEVSYAIELAKAADAGVVNPDSNDDIEHYIRQKHPNFLFSKAQMKGIINKFHTYHFALEGKAQTNANSS